MIISNENRFIFFKPMKTAGSSIEVFLSQHCGEDDILTGSDHEDEILSSSFRYPKRNNIQEILLDGQEAIDHLTKSGNSHLINSSLEENKVSILYPRFHMHSTPVQFKNNSELEPIFKDYYTFTIIRNPWDTMISFFWWSFYHPPTIHVDEYGNVVFTEDPGNFSLTNRPHIAPLEDDSIETLKRKFQSFISTYADFQGPYGLDKGENILEWFFKINSEFYSIDDLDFVIRYENLQEDFNTVCEKIKISPGTLPRLKTTQRKAKINYRHYYNSQTREMIESLFASWTKKFNYSF